MQERRTYLLDPGESLIVNDDIDIQSERISQFVKDTGLSRDDLVSTPIPTLPMLDYASGERTSIRQFKGVTPDLLWHPYMWLPQRLAVREEWEFEDGQRITEPSDVWSIRVALEFNGTELYNQQEGSWLDVLALVGINLDNPTDYDRVDAWLKGTPDPDLDSIDLTEFLDSDDSKASDLAYTQAPWITARNTQYAALWVLRRLEQLDNQWEEAPDEQLKDYLTIILARAVHCLKDYAQEEDYDELSRMFTYLTSEEVEPNREDLKLARDRLEIVTFKTGKPAFELMSTLAPDEAESAEPAETETISETTPVGLLPASPGA